MKTKCLTVRAHELAGIESGIITQIRRLVTPQPEPTPALDKPIPVKEWVKQGEAMIKRNLTLIHTKGAGVGLTFPGYPYKPGDVLWIKSSHKQRMAITFDGRDYHRYFQNVKKDADTWLKVVSIHAEQLHSITSTDAEKMGIQHFLDGTSYRIPLSNFGVGSFRSPDPVLASVALFNRTHKVKMDQNPFVWVIDVQPIQKPQIA